MRYQVASIQYDCRYMEKEYNLQQLVALTKEAAAKGAKLIVLPEMCATGYYFADVQEAEEMAELIPEGDTVQLFIGLAKELDCYIVFGLPEISEGKLFNSAVLVGPEGYWGCHRKVQHYVPDSTWAKVGDRPLEVFDTPIGRISLLICMDVSYPELPRIDKVLGAQIICSPMNWCEYILPSSIWITRAYENQVYFIASNRKGAEKAFEFTGYSAIIAPNGEVLNCLPEGDGIVMSTIDLDVDYSDDQIPQRRPELYSSLQLQRYPWPQNNYYQAFSEQPIPAGGKFKAAVAQVQPVIGDVEKSMDLVKESVLKASSDGVSILTFPELILGGNPESAEQANSIALAADAPELAQLSQLAAEKQINIFVGLVLKENENLYNSAACILADGSMTFYKKSHLSAADKVWAQTGDVAGFFVDVPYARAGIIIGGEVMVTEMSRMLANYGCDIILVLADLEKINASYPGSSEGDDHWHIGRVRGNENNTFIAIANQKGHSGIFSPNMFVITLEEVILKEDGIASYEIDTDFFLADENGKVTSTNPVREKAMLSSRHTIWCDPLFKKM